MNLDKTALKNACREVARQTMWATQPVDVAEIEVLTDRFIAIALQHEEFVTGQNRDPNLITRAVRYLGHGMAIPPMKNDTQWFDDMLTVLVELACPNTLASSELEDFFADIELGIRQSRAVCSN